MKNVDSIFPIEIEKRVLFMRHFARRISSFENDDDDDDDDNDTDDTDDVERKTSFASFGREACDERRRATGATQEIR